MFDSSNPSLYRQIRSEVKRELSSERAVEDANHQVTPAPSCKEDEIHYTHYAADGVYFRCPLLGFFLSSFSYEKSFSPNDTSSFSERLS